MKNYNVEQWRKKGEKMGTSMLYGLPYIFHIFVSVIMENMSNATHLHKQRRIFHSSHSLLFRWAHSLFFTRLSKRETKIKEFSQEIFVVVSVVSSLSIQSYRSCEYYFSFSLFFPVPFDQILHLTSSILFVNYDEIADESMLYFTHLK